MLVGSGVDVKSTKRRKLAFRLSMTGYMGVPHMQLCPYHDCGYRCATCAGTGVLLLQVQVRTWA